MATLIRKIDTYSDGSYQITDAGDPPGEKPQPLPDAPFPAWFPSATDKPFMVRPWDEYQGEASNPHYTNAVNPYSVYDNEGVHPNWTKPPTRLDRNRDWIQRIQDLNTERILDLFVQSGFGFCDRNTNPVNPWTDSVSLDAIDCSLNRRNCLDVVLKSGNKWVVTQSQSFQAGPDNSKTYDSHPHLMAKQVLAVKDLSTYRTSEVGDCIWDFVTDGGVALRLSECWFYPDVPFTCLLDGYAVAITQLALSGSDTYGLVDSGELLPGWYHLDGQSGEHGEGEPAKTIYDYFCRVAGVNWPQPTAPIAGWKKV